MSMARWPMLPVAQTHNILPRGYTWTIIWEEAAIRRYLISKVVSNNLTTYLCTIQKSNRSFPPDIGAGAADEAILPDI